MTAQDDPHGVSVDFRPSAVANPLATNGPDRAVGSDAAEADALRVRGLIAGLHDAAVTPPADLVELFAAIQSELHGALLTLDRT